MHVPSEVEAINPRSTNLVTTGEDHVTFTSLLALVFSTAKCFSSAPENSGTKIAAL